MIPYKHLNTSEDLFEVDGRIVAPFGRLAEDWKLQLQIRLCEQSRHTVTPFIFMPE